MAGLKLADQALADFAAKEGIALPQAAAVPALEGGVVSGSGRSMGSTTTERETQTLTT